MTNIAGGIKLEKDATVYRRHQELEFDNGYGQALVWYAKEEKSKNYLERLKNINEYDGENYIYKTVK